MIVTEGVHLVETGRRSQREENAIESIATKIGSGFETGTGMPGLIIIITIITTTTIPALNRQGQPLPLPLRVRTRLRGSSEMGTSHHAVQAEGPRIDPTLEQRKRAPTVVVRIGTGMDGGMKNLSEDRRGTTSSPPGILFRTRRLQVSRVQRAIMRVAMLAEALLRLIMSEVELAEEDSCSIRDDTIQSNLPCSSAPATRLLDR